MTYLPHSSGSKPTFKLLSLARKKKAARAPPHCRRSPCQRVHPLERDGPIVSAAPGLLKVSSQGDTSSVDVALLYLLDIYFVVR
jgi:hypothetical protein